MKKWLIVLLALLMLSGCAFDKAWKWFNKMDWERDDQTVRVVHIFMK
jgi:uncharacterized protein YcfL